MSLKYCILLSCALLLACKPAAQTAVQAEVATAPLVKVVGGGMPDIDLTNGIYEVPVNDDVSYKDLIESLTSISAGMNMVNPANFPIGEHMQKRDIDPKGIKEVRTFCNLGMGTEIFLDHPEFLVFAPCRIAIYEKENKLYMALARPTFDLKNIKNPTERAKQSAQQVEDSLIELMDRARQGDF